MGLVIYSQVLEEQFQLYKYENSQGQAIKYKYICSIVTEWL